MILLIPDRDLYRYHDTADFTATVIEMRFETGEVKLKELELGMFVGSGRFLVEAGQPVTVEYKLSRVVKG